MKTVSWLVAGALTVCGFGTWAHARTGDGTPLRVQGHVEPQTRVAISATLSLPVVALPIKEGQHVTRGSKDGSLAVPASVLARLDDSDLQAALRAAEAKRDTQIAELAAAQVRLTVLESQLASVKVCMGEAERSWGRCRQLIGNKLASSEEADSSQCKFLRLQAEHATAERSYAAGQATLTVLQKTLAVAEAELERAKLALAAATITAPLDGTITRINVAVGEVVTGTIHQPGTVLMEIADMEHLVLVTQLDEETVGQVPVGTHATVHLKGYGAQEFAGTVESVSLCCTEGKDGARQFQARLRLETGSWVIPAGLGGEAVLDAPAVAQADK